MSSNRLNLPLLITKLTGSCPNNFLSSVVFFLYFSINKPKTHVSNHNIFGPVTTCLVVVVLLVLVGDRLHKKLKAVMETDLLYDVLRSRCRPSRYFTQKNAAVW